MSETVLKVFLNELQKICLVCKKCKTVMEIPIPLLQREDIPQLRPRDDVRCPGCREVMRPGGGTSTIPAPTDALDALPEIWKKLEAICNFELQFVVSEAKKDS